MARGPLRISRAGRVPTVKHLGPGTLDFALRSVRGGKRAIMDELAPRAVRFEPRLAPAITKWQGLTQWQRRFVTLDDLAVESGLTKGEFLAAMVRTGFELTDALTDLIVACAFPCVLGACVRRARRPNGLADRQLLFEHFSVASMDLALEQAADKVRRLAETTRTGAMNRID